MLSAIEAAQPIAKGTSSPTSPWQMPPSASTGGAFPVWQPLIKAHWTLLPANNCCRICTDERKSVSPCSSSKAK
ncbi:MAG: hypothetical protein WBB08_04980 [Halobacteriota archaeon]